MGVLVTAHAVSTLLLTGMIWTVQVVHYPLFTRVGPDGFVAYEASHSVRMAALVAVPWSVQGLTTAGLLLVPPPGVPTPLVGAAAALAATPVVVTLLASVPAHRQLGDGFDAAVHRRLVRTNWVRTAAWSVHSGVAVAIAVTAG